MTLRKIAAAALAFALVASASGLVLAQQPYFRVTTPSGTGQGGNGGPPGQEPNNPGQPLSLSLSGTPAAEGMVGLPLTAFSFNLSGGKAPYTYALTGLDEFNVTGNQVVGTPLVAGTRSFELTVTDADAESRSISGSIATVHSQFSASMTAPAQANAVMGTPIQSIRIVPSGGKAPYVFGNTGTIPGGLNYADGELSGTPNQAGEFDFALTVAQSYAGVPLRTSDTYHMVVAIPPLTVSGDGIPAEYGIGTALSPRPSIVATGGTGPYTYTATDLPPGMQLASDGTTTGAPNAAGPYSFTLTARDSSNPQRSGTRNFSVTAYEHLTVALSKPAYLNSGTPVTGFSVASSGGKGTARTYTIVGGTLPTGVNMLTDGTFTGSPSGSGSATFKVRVQDELGTMAETADQQVHYAPPLAITTTLPDGEQNQSYDQVITTGGRGPITTTMTSGSLPTGVQFSNGRVYGYPTNSGTFTFQASTTDADGRTDSKTVTLTVSSSAKAASRGLISAASFSQTVGAASNMFLRWAPPFGTHENASPTNPAKILEFAKDPVEYDLAQAGTVLSATNTTSGGGVTFTMTYTFSEDVVASSLDQKIAFGEGANCTNQNVTATYQASMDGVSWSPLTSVGPIRGNATVIKVGYGGTYYNLNHSFTPTTLRRVRATYVGTGCSSGYSSIYLRSGIVK